MLRTTILLIALCGMGAAGCRSSSPTDSTRDALLDPLIPIVHEVYTGFAEPDRLVVRDAETWADVYARSFAGRSEVPPRPAVDFASEMILVAAQGSQGSSGYDISIDRAAAQAGRLMAEVIQVVPDERCPVLAVITSPVVMVRVPALSGRVEFVERRVVRQCEPR
jgi:hypothetical protein